MIAYYEKQMTGMWQLAVYPERQSDKGANGKTVERHPITFDVPDSCLENGRVNLTKVAEQFPFPG